MRYNYFLSGIIAFESIRLSLLYYRQNNFGVIFITIGWVLYMIFLSLFHAKANELLPFLSVDFSIIMVNLALIIVPICYSLMLAVDAARINRDLNHKLKEVENLHTEKEEILATQNETLERQIIERTAELNQSLKSLQSTQAQLIQSEKLASLGELTAGIAHEIQNPLNFVNNFAEVSVDMAEELKKEINKPQLDKGLIEELATDLALNQEKINHHGQRASSIVKGMLEHSRTSTGVKEPTDINALADEFLRLAYHGLRAKDNSFNAAMETHFDPDLPRVEVIPQDIGRVLLNLINNAFYAVNEKAKQGIDGYSPVVTLSTRLRLTSAELSNRRSATERVIEISVKDNGNGIPDAIKDKIFQPFFTTKPTGQGTGLGLSLAYDIVVKGHGGTLEVSSVPNEGTEFVIRLV